MLGDVVDMEDLLQTLGHAPVEYFGVNLRELSRSSVQPKVAPRATLPAQNKLFFPQYSGCPTRTATPIFRLSAFHNFVSPKWMPMPDEGDVGCGFGLWTKLLSETLDR